MRSRLRCHNLLFRYHREHRVRLFHLHFVHIHQLNLYGVGEMTESVPTSAFRGLEPPANFYE